MIEHEWREVHEHSEGFEARGCSICGLRDRKQKDERWAVDWSCIRPVPEEISYEDLRDELAQHSPHIWRPHTGIRQMSFSGNILCHGVPGRWYIGLSKGDGFPYVFRDLKLYRGELVFWPIGGRGVAKLEQGFALLLRAMRARCYNPYLRSEYRYAQELAKQEYIAALED